MWCKSLTLEKYISFRMKWFFSPPFLSVSPFLLLNLVRRQCYAYAIGLYTRPEIKSWPDVKFCAHAHCSLPRCSLQRYSNDHLSHQNLSETTQTLARFFKNNLFPFSLKAVRDKMRGKDRKLKRLSILAKISKCNTSNSMGKQNYNILSFGYTEVSS